MTAPEPLSALPLSVLHREFLTRRISSLSPKNAVVVAPETTAADVVARICAARSGAVLVVDASGASVGIVTERDILNQWQPGKPSNPRSVAEMMTKKPQVMHGNASVARAIHFMANGGFRHLPVIFPPPELPKVISSKDLVDSIHGRLTAKLLNPDSRVALGNNVVDRFFASGINLLNPDPPLVLAASNTAADALELLRQHHHGAVAICEPDKRVAGIFTERDYLTKIVAPQIDPSSLKLSELMTAKPHTLLKTASVAMAFSLLSEGGYRHIPLVDANEKITGILSVRSFLNYLSKSIVAALDSYEAQP